MKQLKGLIDLERRCLTTREEVEHFERKTRRLADLIVSTKDMQKTAPEKVPGEDLRGVQGAGGSEGKRSFGARTKEAQADQV